MTVGVIKERLGVHGEMLEQLFARFNESSAKLEMRYQALQRETEELRRQLAEKDKEAKRNEKLALLGQTAAALAHEVRNPLGAIRLYASMLKKDLKEMPEKREIVEFMERSIHALDNVVSNILHFSKDSRSEAIPVNIHALIHEQVQNLRNLESWSKVRFSVHLFSPQFLLGNDVALRQCLYNLLLNAGQAIKYEGDITILNEGCLTEQGPGVRITIRDSGKGIDPTILPSIFEPFVTTKNEGTGLGLAIVRKIVAQHGGAIEARNSGGAEFEITIPLKGIQNK